MTSQSGAHAAVHSVAHAAVQAARRETPQNMPKKLYQMSIEERLSHLVSNDVLSRDAADAYLASVVDDSTSRMSENVIGELVSPIGIVESIEVNGERCTVPMTTEEPSVVAAANHGAKMAVSGFIATSHRDGIYGQILLDAPRTGMKPSDFNWQQLNDVIPDLIRLVTQRFDNLSKRGGGLVSIETHEHGMSCDMLIKVNTAQAMGANIVNSILKCLVQEIERVLPGLNAIMAIVSNYPSQLVDVESRIPFAQLAKTESAGRSIARNIDRIAHFAEHNAYRAVTNNKGIMNGVDAVIAACGNDTRAVEAACHQLAALSGQYLPLSHWRANEDSQELVGTMTLALPIGAVGGAIASRPAIRRNMELMRKPDVRRLSELVASVGLANNLAALHALAGEGIQHGHMRLQAVQTAVAVGANDEEIAQLTARMVARSDYSQSWAADELKRLRDAPDAQ